MASTLSWSSCFSPKSALLSGEHFGPGNSWGQWSLYHEAGKPCSWGQLTWGLFWLGRRHSICLSLFYWPVKALCRLLELFPRFHWHSSFSSILMEAFVISEPSNMDFKLQLEISFRNGKGKDFCFWSRVLGYQLRNTRRNLRDVLAYISLLGCTSSLSSCWGSVSVERKLWSGCAVKSFLLWIYSSL